MQSRLTKKENAPKWLESSDTAAMEKCMNGMRECLLHNEPVNTKQDISGMKLQTLCERGKQSVQIKLRNTIIGQCTHLMFGEYTKVMAKVYVELFGDGYTKAQLEDAKTALGKLFDNMKSNSMEIGVCE